MTPTPPQQPQAQPRPRPANFDEIGFERAKPVVWFSPSELLLTAKQLVISKMFSDYADKRELIGTLPDPEIRDYTDRGELWLDYVADLGDGFDATYSVATLLAAEELAVTDLGSGAAVTTRRGNVLIMGGDEVYPAASIDNYEQRTIGPYKAALPACDDDPPDLFVLPGNHDWYDGLTSWMRMFAQRKTLGGWQTHQSRSYFALRLPHGWWLWGIDVQFDSYIDVPQMDFFQRVVDEAVAPGDQIILCSATPEWVDSHRNDPESYRNLDYFDRKIIAPSGATMRVAIAGNAHHFAHFASDTGDRHLLTSGGGGAYLSATHGLPDRLTIPPVASADRSKSEPATDFKRVSEFPSVETSRRLGRGVWRLPAANMSFVALIGLVYGFFAASTLSGVRAPSSERSLAAWWDSYIEAVREVDVVDVIYGVIGRPLSLLVSAVVVAAIFGMTKRRGPRRLIVGSVHALIQTAVLIAVICAAVAIASRIPEAIAPPIAVVLAGLIGAITGSLTLAGYFSFGDTFGRNVNEQFSAQRIEGFKNFVRFHVGEDGALTIFPIGLRDVAHHWRVRTDGAPNDAWIVSDGDELKPELIEGPIRLEKQAAP